MTTDAQSTGQALLATNEDGQVALSSDKVSHSTSPVVNKSTGAAAPLVRAVLAMPHAVIGVRCHFCSKFRPAWRTHQLTEAQTICDYCVEWHNNALEVLAGGCPKGCQACGATWEVLRDSTPGVEVRLYVVPRDGVLQLHCGPCVRLYAAARSDLFAGTAYGNQLKI